MRFLFFISVLFFLGCNSKTKTVTQERSPETQSVQYARHFRFAEDKNGNKVVEIIHPDTKKVVAQLEPLRDNKNVIALSGTFIGMMDKLGLASYITGVSEMKYIHNQTVRKNYADRKVMEAGYDTQLSLESIVASKPAMILHSGYSAEFPHEKQFENVGIRCIPVYDWREETPLGKAEWIKVYGFLYGKQELAEELFASIEEKYNQLKEEAKDLEPSKLVLSGNVMGSEWYLPAGNSFYARLLKDANITYNYYDSEGTGSIGLTQEKILSDNRHAAYWINPGAASLKELRILNPKAILFDAFNNGQVYCHSRNENFYWEVSSIEPDKLLSDLVQITHPDYQNKEGLHFYTRLE